MAVAFSGGKDSIVVLDLCHRYFEHVHAFHMHYVDGLSFNESIIRWAEEKYQLEILRLPHWETSVLHKYGNYGKAAPGLRHVKIGDIYAHVREYFGCKWIATGERAADSVVRRARIMQDGSINIKQGKIMPAAFFKKHDVLNYIKLHNLKITPEYKVLGRSFAGMIGKDLALIEDHYPEDYAKIIKVFPLVGAETHRYRMQNAGI